MAMAKAEAVAPVTVAQVKRPRLQKASCKLSEQGRRFWFIKAPPGTTQEDPRYPDFWADAAKVFCRHDIIFLIPDDESWEMEMRVEAVRADGVEISVSKVYARKGIVQAMTMVGPDHHSEYRPGMGWCVVRVSDKFPVVKGHALEQTAIAQWQREQPRPAV